jgi:hypothetical protein
MPTWIERMFRRECIRRLSAWAALVLLTALMLTADRRYARNFLYGPFPAAENELSKITNPDSADHYFVKVTGSKIIDTGIQEIEIESSNGVEKSRKVAAGYYALQVGDRFLIVKSSTPISNAASGELVFLSGEIHNQLLSSVGPQRLKQDFYPLMLQANGFREGGYAAIGFAVAVLVCLFFFARPAWMRFKDLSLHPAFQRIKSWGEIHSTSMEAENEFKSSVRYKSSGIRVTDRYAIKNAFFAFNLFRFHDLVWAYKLVTQRRVNFIPVGKSYSAVLVFNGGDVQIQGKQQLVDEILQYAATRAPWAVFGFSDQLKVQLKKNPAVLYAQIEARRDKLNAK